MEKTPPSPEQPLSLDVEQILEWIQRSSGFLALLRRLKGQTVEALAESSGVDADIIWGIEANEGLPNRQSLIDLAQGYGIDPGTSTKNSCTTTRKTRREPTVFGLCGDQMAKTEILQKGGLRPKRGIERRCKQSQPECSGTEEVDALTGRRTGSIS